MKIVNFGSTFKIYGDDLKTYDKLPAATYKVEFHPRAGFSLEKIDNFESMEAKIYGSHPEKISKVLKSYDKFERSLGIILSGNKGMGKSMFVQLIAEAVVKKNIPVIMVTKAFPGIADFIEQIDQEALIILDEFEKMFNPRNEEAEKQENLLGLFDGTSQKKRIYAITVNDLNKVNEFMLSRPGRFHYHIRFDYPTAAEIEIYLKDKLEEQYHGEIKHVVAFANRVKLNYDSLRAIAFELNEGYTFRSAIGDLNILTTDSQRYDVKVILDNGKTIELRSKNINLFSETIQLSGYMQGGDYFSMSFNPANIVEETHKMIVDGEFVTAKFQDEDDEPLKGIKVESVIITHTAETGVNYKFAS
ncbi:ATP-binding protein [Bacillus paranthracis]|uniref:ATP-binding protein n=1 Tax=Bacillus cereus group TaxID=86661 RepID=UPI00111C9AC0|nr:MULTISPECIES: ATP-binding protein [Bacillus cereus group]MEC4620806.1 ATP-binding protein [Bacillus paranthracis]TNP19050.1 ATP-binding protein [Bacillus tropicus]